MTTAMARSSAAATASTASAGTDPRCTSTAAPPSSPPSSRCPSGSGSSSWWPEERSATRWSRSTAGRTRTRRWWQWGRWPLGLLTLVVAIAVLFDHSPRRRQPALSWLALGSGVTVVLSMAAAAGLAAYVNVSGSFSSTYGPLAGIFALLVWSLLSSVSLFYGVAVCANSRHCGPASPSRRTTTRAVRTSSRSATLRGGRWAAAAPGSAGSRGRRPKRRRRRPARRPRPRPP